MVKTTFKACQTAAYSGRWRCGLITAAPRWRVGRGGRLLEIVVDCRSQPDPAAMGARRGWCRCGSRPGTGRRRRAAVHAEKVTTALFPAGLSRAHLEARDVNRLG